MRTDEEIKSEALTGMIVATIPPQVGVGDETLESRPVNGRSRELELFPDRTHPRSSGHVTHGHSHPRGQSPHTPGSSCTGVDHRGRGSHGGAQRLLGGSTEDVVNAVRVGGGVGRVVAPTTTTR